MGTFSNVREYELLREHGEPGDPDYPHRGGAKPAAGKGTKAANYKRPTPVQVKTVDEAIPLILKGSVVELPDPVQANTLLRKLAAMANEAKAKGEDAPTYDLCNVSVAGTNLFCAGNKGVDRIHMPQFAGLPVPGSAADKLPKDKSGDVNGAEQFIEHLTQLGIGTVRSKVAAARLKATQRELVGPKVASMMVGESWDPGAEPIFISRDHYVIDGHHRWAAVVGRDLADGKLGGLRMNVIKVDAPISEVLQIANRWADDFGLARKGVNTKHPKPDRPGGKPKNGLRTSAKWSGAQTHPSLRRRRAA